MKCPKCGEKSTKKDKVCRNCGTVLKKERKFLKLTSKSNKSEAGNVPLLETSLPSGVITSKFKKIKLLIIAGLVVFLIIFFLILFFRLTSNKGKKRAEDLSEYLGVNVNTAEEKLDMHMKDNSSYAVINRSDTFDYIYESDDDISIDDIRFPEWTVTVLKTPSEKIDNVVFTDYNVLKSDSRGDKFERRPDLDSFGRNTKISTVKDSIDADPFRITYELTCTKYEYRYCYKQDNGDIQSVALIIVADADGKFFYSTSEDLDPFFINDKEPALRVEL